MDSDEIMEKMREAIDSPNFDNRERESLRFAISFIKDTEEIFK